MNLALKVADSTDPASLNWEKVRREYFKVWADFPMIAKPFGITLSGQQRNALGQMLIAMDLIDSAIDRESCPHTRSQICKDIVCWMNTRDDWRPLLEPLEFDRLVPLRNIIKKQNIEAPFLAAANRVFRASEAKRNATTAFELIRNLIDEGQAAAEMTIQILGANTNAGLNQFLQRIMRIGTIVDTLLDAQDDFDRGILKLVPNRVFRWRLKSAIARQLPGLIARFPDRRLLWRYCLSYTTDELDLISDHATAWRRAA